MIVAVIPVGAETASTSDQLSGFSARPSMIVAPHAAVPVSVVVLAVIRTVFFAGLVAWHLSTSS
eukprot:COSAG05_NODE_4732_length_1392_cov_4.034803_2_plen_64_part_00